MKRLLSKAIDLIAPSLIFFVFLCLAFVVVLFFSGITFPYSAFVVHVLLGGFIGGITNKIAIKMLFEKKWYLPGSGVLQKKHREIIHSLARTVETHLINSEMIQSELTKLLKAINISKVETILNNIIDEFRSDLHEYLKAQQTRDEIRNAIKTKLGFLGKFLNVTGIKGYEEMTDTIVAELDTRIGGFRITKPMIVQAIHKVGTIEDFLFRPNNELVQRHYHSDRSVFALLFEKIDIRNMVINKLSAYEPSQIRDIIEENIRAHLLWLEVFGVILGMLFSGTLVLVLQIYL